MPPTGPPAEPSAEQEVPVCPRHPDRESYVRCQRCRRPVCPECQRPAAVGVQCVDCVREGQKSVRQARTVFGGTVTDGRPVVSFTLIGMCVVVYLFQQVMPGLTGDISFVPALGESQPWRFLTSAFAHGPIFHIAFNMYALFLMGQYLEPMLGRARYIALYLLSAVGGSVVYLLLSGPSSTYAEAVAGQGVGWWTPAVGASGAVFGLFGAYLVLQRRLNRSAAGMYVIIGINAVIGFVYPNIAWQAHLGGFVVGAACAAAIGYLGRAKSMTERGRPTVHWAALAGIGVVLVVLAVARYALA
ncbi:rhomboid family intramembrane serine protease [Phycicoccus sp. BSK3Z-2]|uniref:Rhomboid family intramembrane serine protease n=1 Tax=Phycicoccus avicenniae TaxID=2828860 RepID=A0A941D9X9_9MICO|nr:rhomboid family intramembrane serine protease [Phycicoccus avicenniae]